MHNTHLGWCSTQTTISTMNIRTTFLTVLAVMAAVALAQPVSPDSTILERAQAETGHCASILQLAWHNPAVAQWHHNYSLSKVAVSNLWRNESQPVRSQLGDHSITWSFDASTYMKHRSSTLWGHASYNNGKTGGIGWNETSDPDVVYPYLMADSVQTADVKTEIYSFSGGYADHRGRWHWGVEASYRAGLHYRNVDPRPRNVTARLDATAGAGWQVTSRYMAAMAISYSKYKQTNEVAFYSELGRDKIFHLTGLIYDYGRFAGAGDETFYRGHQWDVTLNWHPVDNNGISATLTATRFTFDKVLKSLNKLPMARATHNSVRAELGWLARQWSVRSWLLASRRTGTENIFGDPAASVYPQIAALDMFHDNRFSIGLDGRWQLSGQRAGIALMPALAYHHHNMIYAEPASRWLVNDLSTSMRAQGTYKSNRTFSVLTFGVTLTSPTSTQLLLPNARGELAGLQRILEHDFSLQAHHHTSLNARLETTVALNMRFALRAAVDWLHGRYTATVTSHQLMSSLSFIF